MTAKSHDWNIGDYVDLGIIATTHGLSDGFSSLLVPVLALIVAELGLSAFEAGTLLSINNAAMLLFLYPLSMLADMTGHKKRLLILGLSVSAAAFLSMRLAGTFKTVAILAFVAGAGNATYHPCGTALTAQRFYKQRAIAISLHGLGGNIGTSIMPLVQSAVVTAMGWRNALALCALPAAVLLPLVGIRFPKAEEPYSKSSPAPSTRGLTRSVVRNQNIVLLGLVYALKAMGSKGMIGFVPLLASQRFSMGTTAIGVTVSAYYTAGIVAKPLMGLLYNRYGARWALAIPLLLTALLALALGFCPWAAMIVPLAALLGAVSPISPIILTAAADLGDEQVLASSVGFIYTCQGLGFLSPLIGGWLIERAGMSTSYVFYAVAILAGAWVATRLPGRAARE